MQRALFRAKEPFISIEFFHHSDCGVRKARGTTVPTDINGTGAITYTLHTSAEGSGGPDSDQTVRPAELDPF